MGTFKGRSLNDVFDAFSVGAVSSFFFPGRTQKKAKNKAKGHYNQTSSRISSSENNPRLLMVVLGKCQIQSVTQ